MDLKVKIYSAMPAFVKRGMTVAYINLRKFREWKAADIQELPAQGQPPKIVYMTGFPRAGTTMLKYYFGSHDGLRQTAFNPVGFFGAWKLTEAVENKDILVDKSNHYIYALKNLFAAYGDAARVCVVIRDPRDSLVSFTKYQENREVPRSSSYWRYWQKQHDELLRIAETEKHGKCIYMIRYEDLVCHPEQAKIDFLKWLGLSVDEAQIDRSYEVHNPGESWHDSVYEHKEVGDHALQKWQQMETLPAWAERLLPAWQDDSRVSELMKRFGYHENGFSAPELSSANFNLFCPDDQTDT